jgi:uracil-DNA glycosylase family 4
VTDAHEALRLLGDRARGCTACRLAETRTTVVFGDGSPDARVVFVGEGPGRNEDLEGLPFVGAAGQLLNRLLAEIDLRREDVYITNVVKCRPPGNRDPLQDEIDSCKGFLAEQIRLIDPDVVVTLGNFATKLLLKQEVGISRLRGRAYPWWNRTVVPTFHPAAALRGGQSVLDAMRQDFALIESVLSHTAEVAEPEPEQMGLF